MEALTSLEARVRMHRTRLPPSPLGRGVFFYLVPGENSSMVGPSANALLGGAELRGVALPGVRGADPDGSVREYAEGT